MTEIYEHECIFCGKTFEETNETPEIMVPDMDYDGNYIEVRHIACPHCFGWNNPSYSEIS